MNVVLDRIFVDVDRLGRTHEERIYFLEMTIQKYFEERFVNIEERISKISDFLKIVVNISNSSLKSSAKGLSILNEKVINWTGKSLDLGDHEKVIKEVNRMNLDKMAEDICLDAEKNLDAGPCFRTRSKFKKRASISFQELKDVVEMHKGVIEENMGSANVLEKLLQLCCYFCPVILVANVFIVGLLTGFLVLSFVSFLVFLGCGLHYFSLSCSFSPL